MLCILHANNILYGYIIQSVDMLYSLFIPVNWILSSLTTSSLWDGFVIGDCFWLIPPGIAQSPMGCSALCAAACQGQSTQPEGLEVTHWNSFQVQPHGRRGQTRHHQPLALGRVRGDQRTWLWWAQAAAEKDHWRYKSLCGCFEHLWNSEKSLYLSPNTPTCAEVLLFTDVKHSSSRQLSVFERAALCLQCS